MELLTVELTGYNRWVTAVSCGGPLAVQRSPVVPISGGGVRRKTGNSKRPIQTADNSRLVTPTLYKYFPAGAGACLPHSFVHVLQHKHIIRVART